ncbi:MAG TPA: hypothetical protein VNH11_26250 [Pirellulales bacterium]|nr:hypothetical protein [Pirellulales bacterium]
MARRGRASMEEKAAEVYQAAEEILASKPDWIAFFKKVLGMEGVIWKVFPHKEQRAAFERTDEYAAIQQMIAMLRKMEDDEDRPKELTKVITVRLPECLHIALRAEATGMETSVNKLCISKLLQVIDDDLVPQDKVGMLRGGAAAKAAVNGRPMRARPRIRIESEARPE